MVIVYTSDEFNKIINDSVFLSEYEEYKTKSCIKIEIMFCFSKINFHIIINEIPI